MASFGGISSFGDIIAALKVLYSSVKALDINQADADIKFTVKFIKLTHFNLLHLKRLVGDARNLNVPMSLSHLPVVDEQDPFSGEGGAADLQETSNGGYISSYPSPPDEEAPSSAITPVASDLDCVADNLDELSTAIKAFDELLKKHTYQQGAAESTGGVSKALLKRLGLPLLSSARKVHWNIIRNDAKEFREKVTQIVAMISQYLKNKLDESG
jgi:hypothetical protein